MITKFAYSLLKGSVSLYKHRKVILLQHKVYVQQYKLKMDNFTSMSYLYMLDDANWYIFQYNGNKW